MSSTRRTSRIGEKSDEVKILGETAGGYIVDADCNPPWRCTCERKALWAVYPFGQQPIAEAYLQQELRRLHALIESLT